MTEGQEGKPDLKQMIEQAPEAPTKRDDRKPFKYTAKSGKGIRLSYNIPADEMISHKSVTDTLTQTCAHLLKLAAWNESLGIMITAEMRVLLDNLLQQIQPPQPPPEEQDGPAPV